jgi:hypothetical protein
MRHLRSLVGIALALIVLGAALPAAAQLRPSTAQITRVAGRVEVQRSGQAAWAAATVGGTLAAGDHIRAMAGGSAELSLADGSTILVAENTRFVVTKLEYDAQSRERNALFHLAAGKVRAQVSKASVQLTRARQSNFAISTPAGVAAVRGTIPVVFYNPQTRQAIIFSIPSPGEDPSAARVTYLNFATGQVITIPGQNFITQIGNDPFSALTAIFSLSPQAQAQIQSPSNPSTAGVPQITAPTIIIVSEAEMNAALAQIFGPGVATGPTEIPGGGPTVTTTDLGRSIATNPPSCVDPSLPGGCPTTP